MINFEVGKIYQYYNTYTKKWHDMKLWEIVENKHVERAIGTKTVKLFKQHLKDQPMSY